MILDRAGGYCFVHVPKTGGQSVCKALGGKSQDVSTHTPLFCVEDAADLFSFGFVRNPWDRMVSLYSFMAQKTFRITDNFDQQALREAGFKDWLMHDEFFMQEDGLPPGEAWRIGWGSSPREALAPMQRRPQWWWLRGCDFVGRYENLSEDFETACQNIGRRNVYLPHVNRSKHSHYRDHYDAESREFIAVHFAEDIERFGYEF